MPGGPLASKLRTIDRRLEHIMKSFQGQAARNLLLGRCICNEGVEHEVSTWLRIDECPKYISVVVLTHG
jgi:hypothetical protein